MSAWLLTWSSWDWGEEYERICENATRENPVSFDWSCCSKKIEIGDEVYLVKLGKDPRGIIAHGIVTEEVYQCEHWDYDKAEQGQQANYVMAKYDTVLNYKEQDILNLSVLKEKCKEQLWHPQLSGIRIKDKVITRLHKLWSEVTKEYPDNPEESFYEEEICSTDSTEGKKKVVYTTKYERDPKVRRDFLKDKHLKCEICGFDFEKVYGDLGKGYIEVHHKKPVCDGVRKTDLDNDLVMLCSNCHRMIHRGKNHMITVEELKEIIKII